MQRELRSFFTLFLGALVWLAAFDPPRLFAQRTNLGLSPQDQQKYDELMRSARRNEIIAYVAAGVGLLLVVAYIPLKIYFNRKTKARKNALRATIQPTENTASPQDNKGPGQKRQA